jgi:hypothetical protein
LGKRSVPLSVLPLVLQSVQVSVMLLGKRSVLPLLQSGQAPVLLLGMRSAQSLVLQSEGVQMLTLAYTISIHSS